MIFRIYFKDKQISFTYKNIGFLSIWRILRRIIFATIVDLILLEIHI